MIIYENSSSREQGVPTVEVGGAVYCRLAEGYHDRKRRRAGGGFDRPEMARKYDLDFVEFLPDLEGCVTRLEFTKRYYERNQKIVDYSDMVVAFTEKENGGTWDTIKRARQKNVPVKVIKPFLLFPGLEEPDDEDDEAVEAVEIRKQKGVGPFHLKRITLGSFTLKLKRYIDNLVLADLINAKDNNPELFCEMVIQDYLNFFEKYNPGVIHAITQAPKSKRHLNRVHPMDLVCRKVADKIGCEYVELFEPWEKPKRGRGALEWEGKIEVRDEVKHYIGKVVYVLDDFVTTGNTLKKCCKALTALEIHTHAVGYVFWS